MEDVIETVYITNAGLMMDIIETVYITNALLMMDILEIFTFSAKRKLITRTTTGWQ